MDDEQLTIERLIEIALFAPVGLALIAHDRLPGELRRRRQALHNRVQLARVIGKFAVQQGRAEFDRRAAGARRPGGGAPADVPVSNAPSGTATTDATPPTRDPATAHRDIGGGGDVGGVQPPTVDDLPIAGYESLAAVHVVQRLGGLRPAELEAVRRFELTHRARRTILAKIDQLQAAR